MTETASATSTGDPLHETAGGWRGLIDGEALKAAIYPVIGRACLGSSAREWLTLDEAAVLLGRPLEQVERASRGGPFIPAEEVFRQIGD